MATENTETTEGTKGITDFVTDYFKHVMDNPGKHGITAVLAGGAVQRNCASAASKIMPKTEYARWRASTLLGGLPVINPK